MVEEIRLPVSKEGRKGLKNTKNESRTVHGNPIILVNTIFQLHSNSIIDNGGWLEELGDWEGERAFESGCRPKLLPLARI